MLLEADSRTEVEGGVDLINDGVVLENELLVCVDDMRTVVRVLLDRTVLLERVDNIEVLDDDLLVVLVVGLVEELFLVDDDDSDELLLVL